MIEVIVEQIENEKTFTIKSTDTGNSIIRSYLPITSWHSVFSSMMLMDYFGVIECGVHDLSINIMKEHKLKERVIQGEPTHSECMTCIEYMNLHKKK